MASNNPFEELQAPQRPGVGYGGYAQERAQPVYQAPEPRYNVQRDNSAPAAQAYRPDPVARERYSDPLKQTQPVSMEQPQTSGFQLYMNDKYHPGYTGGDTPNMGDYKRYMAAHPEQGRQPPPQQPYWGVRAGPAWQAQRDSRAPGDRPIPGSMSDFNDRLNQASANPTSNGYGVNTPNYQQRLRPDTYGTDLYIRPYTTDGSPTRSNKLVDVRFSDQTDYTPSWQKRRDDMRAAQSVGVGNPTTRESLLRLVDPNSPLMQARRAGQTITLDNNGIHYQDPQPQQKSAEQTVRSRKSAGVPPYDFSKNTTEGLLALQDPAKTHGPHAQDIVLAPPPKNSGINYIPKSDKSLW